MASGDEVDWKAVEAAVQRIMGVSRAWDTALGWQGPEEEEPEPRPIAPRRPSLPSLGDLKKFDRD